MTLAMKQRKTAQRAPVVGDFYDRSVALLATFRRIMEGQGLAPLYQPIVDQPARRPELKP